MAKLSELELESALIENLHDGERLPTYSESGRPADWSLIPSHMTGAMRRYIEHGISPGHFLTALLSNDLRGTFQRADEENSAAVGNYVQFLYNYAPSGCWGSPERFDAWFKQGGLSKHAA